VKVTFKMYLKKTKSTFQRYYFNISPDTKCETKITTLLNRKHKLITITKIKVLYMQVLEVWPVNRRDCIILVVIQLDMTTGFFWRLHTKIL